MLGGNGWHGRSTGLMRELFRRCEPRAGTRTAVASISSSTRTRQRARGVPSPDEWDAVALTFAEPVRDSLNGFDRVIEYPRSAVY